MDLRQASYVVAVVDEGSFTAAADAIPVSQPALSQAVARLERELGTPLFHRHGRSVTVTAAGEAFIGPARQMLRDAEVARAAVDEVTGLVAGHLDLVVLATLVVEPLVDLVGRFRSLHPGVTVRISDPESGDDVVAQVADGRSELGLGDLAVDTPSLEVDRLGRQRLLAVLPPGTALPSSGRLPIARLARFPLVTTPPGTSTRRLLAEALREQDPEHDALEVGVVTEHREAIIPLVMAGAGAAVLPEPLARAASRLGASVAPLTPGIDRAVNLVRRRGPLSPAASAFRSLAVTPP